MCCSSEVGGVNGLYMHASGLLMLRACLSPDTLMLTLSHSFICLLLAHSLAHSLTHSFTHSLSVYRV